jgi:NAD(P)-dependent dehydrogenase (short-subunit alcohol dehydrogenase family)
MGGRAGPQGIRVNTVAPGPTLTAQNEQYADVIEQLVANHPARRTATAADVGAAVVFLASNDAAHIHGVTLPVDGGALTRSYVGI